MSKVIFSSDKCSEFTVINYKMFIYNSSKPAMLVYILHSFGPPSKRNPHYNDVIMSVMASKITSLTIVYSNVYSGSKKTSKLRVTGLCEGNSPVTTEFPAQRASNAENISIWWRHHVIRICWGGGSKWVFHTPRWDAVSCGWVGTTCLSWDNLRLLWP